MIMPEQSKGIINCSIGPKMLEQSEGIINCSIGPKMPEQSEGIIYCSIDSVIIASITQQCAAAEI